MSEGFLFREYLNREEEPGGPDVLFLQAFLKAWGFGGPDMELDGEYGPITASAAARLQAHIGLTGSNIDGNFDPKTKQAVKEYYGIDFDTIPSVLEYSLMK